MKHKISILFYVKSSKVAKNGLLSIYQKITINGTRIELSISRFVEKSKWNTAAGKMKGSNKNMNIVYITFGETRVFKLRHKYNKSIPIVEIPLYHATLPFMSGTINSQWEHHISKSTKELLLRINFTFRQQ